MKANSLRQRLASFLRSRTWLRFSLRSLLLITLLSALAVKWWMTPEMTLHRQPDGAVIQYSTIRQFDPSTGQTLEAQRHGRYEVRDPFGRLLVRGMYENGLPAGTWSVFHPSGRRAMNGVAVQGQRSGVWTAQNASGSIRSVVTYDARSANSKSYRAGISEVRDERGRVQQGQFVDDYRDGEWVTTTDAPKKTSERTTYRAGVRHGKSSHKESYYLHDHRVSQDIGLPKRLEQELHSNDGGRQYEALRHVVTLGNLTEANLLQVLAADDTSLQIAALRLVAKEKAVSESVTQLVEQLTKASKEEVSIEAWFTLYRLVPQRRQEIARQLIHLAARSPLPIRYFIEYQLGRLPGPLPEVLSSELDSENGVVRRATLEVFAVSLSVPIPDRIDWAWAEREVDLAKLLEKARTHKDPKIAAAAAHLEQQPR